MIHKHSWNISGFKDVFHKLGSNSNVVETKLNFRNIFDLCDFCSEEKDYTGGYLNILILPLIKMLPLSSPSATWAGVRKTDAPAVQPVLSSCPPHKRFLCLLVDGQIQIV